MSLDRPPTHAYVGLGSNLGDRAANLLMGIRGMLDAGLRVSRLSRIYETEPVETFLQPLFLNMVAELDGDLPHPEALMAELLKIERSLGRNRDQAKGPRTIDLDLLLSGNEVSQSQLLTLPHPRLQYRRFVLVPLAELCPEAKHPVLQLTMSELLQRLVDRSAVSLWLPGDDSK